MYAMSRIPHQREAVLHRFPCQCQPQRKSLLRSVQRDFAELVAETALQFEFEGKVVQRHEPFRIPAVFRPDQRRAVSLQRQNRKWPGRQEMLFRPAVVIAFMGNSGDDAELVIGPVDNLDPRHFPKFRAHAVSGNEKLALYFLTACQRYAHGGFALGKGGNAG